jgi:hypothetical protein
MQLTGETVEYHATSTDHTDNDDTDNDDNTTLRAAA